VNGFLHLLQASDVRKRDPRLLRERGCRDVGVVGLHQPDRATLLDERIEA
jgi:hypothetical protein